MNLDRMFGAIGARAEDQRKLMLMAPVFFICGIAEMMNYNGFMTLFNQRLGSAYLPYVYAAEAVILPLEAWVMSWLSARLPKPKLMRTMYGLMLGIVCFHTLALILLAVTGIKLTWYYPVLFIFSNFVVRQQTILLWSLAVDTCSTQQAKRLMPIFVGAATLGGVAAGLLAQLIGSWLGPEAVYAGGAVLLLIAWRNYSQTIQQYLVPLSLKAEAAGGDETVLSAGTVFRHALRSPFLLTIIILMTLMPALYFLIEYEFLNITHASYPTEKEFSRYFGIITMLLFVLAFLLQTVSGKLMAKLGASQMLTVISAVYVLAFAGATVFINSAAALPVISIGYMLIYLLLYYSAEPSYQLFFKTFPLGVRDSYRYAAQGISTSAGIMIGAGLQFLHSGFHIRWMLLSLVGVCGAALLLGLAALGRNYYKRELLNSVQSLGGQGWDEQFEEYARSPEAMAKVRAMLTDSSDSAKEIALQMLGRLQDPRDLHELLKLVEDPNPRIRAAAVKALNPETADLPAMAKIASFLEDEDEQIRTEGVRQIGRMKHMEHQALFFLRQKLLDRHPAVVAEAVKAMYSFRNASSYDACAEVIDRILEEGGESAVYICRVVADLELKDYIPKVEKLLDDDHPAARTEAIVCLGRLQAAHVIPRLLQQLPTMDQEMTRKVLDSFLNIGQGGKNALLESLNGAHSKGWSVAVQALASLLSEEEVRTVLTEQALNKIDDLEAAAAYAASFRQLGHEEIALLSDMRWNEVRSMVVAAVWSILARLTDGQVTEAMRKAAGDPDEEVRSNALEVLAEGLGERRLSQKLLEVLEGGRRVAVREEAELTLKAALAETDDWWREMAAAAAGKEEDGMVNEQQMMGRLNKAVFLRQVPYFAHLTLEELGLIANIAEETVWPDDAKLLERGKPNPEMYVVIEGNVELTSVSAAGWEGTIGVLGTGDVCGVTSALDGTPSTVTAQSLLGEVRVLKLVGEEVSRLIRLYPEIGIGLLHASFARIRLLEEMMMRIDS